MKKLLYVSPILSRSGYGDHAREFAKFLLSIKHEYTIHILATPWGSNPSTSLNDDVSLATELSNCFIEKENLHSDYDVYVQLGMPTEFRPAGKYNIGITAGVETDTVSDKFIDGCNNMDLVIVPSEFTKSTFMSSTYNADGNVCKVTTPIKVVHEYAHDNFYDHVGGDPISELDHIEEDFCFLFVGQWISSPTGDGGRKNIKSLVRTFKHAFAETPNPPALVLKTNGTNFSVSDYHQTHDSLCTLIEDETLADLPNIYLLHGDVEPQKLSSLYTHPKIKAFVSHTKGEGFGRPALEASLCGLPILITNWSGHLDFLDKKHASLISGEFVPVGITNEIFTKNSQWIQVSEQESAMSMKDIYSNYTKHKESAMELMKKNLIKFTEESALQKYKTIFESDIVK